MAADTEWPWPWTILNAIQWQSARKWKWLLWNAVIAVPSLSQLSTHFRVGIDNIWQLAESDPDYNESDSSNTLKRIFGHYCELWWPLVDLFCFHKKCDREELTYGTVAKEWHPVAAKTEKKRQTCVEKCLTENICFFAMIWWKVWNRSVTAVGWTACNELFQFKVDNINDIWALKAERNIFSIAESVKDEKELLTWDGIKDRGSALKTQVRTIYRYQNLDSSSFQKFFPHLLLAQVSS